MRPPTLDHPSHRLSRPRQALYWTGACAKHGARVMFGTYYRTMTQVETGCLPCWWDEDVTFPPAGTSFQADLVEDASDPTSPEWNNTYSADEADHAPTD